MYNLLEFDRLKSITCFNINTANSVPCLGLRPNWLGLEKL